MSILGLTQKYRDKTIDKIRRIEDEELLYREFYDILLEWTNVRQREETLVSYFKKNGYKKIAIYGMADLGEALLNELKGSDISVEYGIDRNADNIFSEIDVYRPDEELKPVDVIVVTAVHYYAEIEYILRGKTDYNIVSLDDVVYGV